MTHLPPQEPWQRTRAELPPFERAFPVSQLHDAGPRSYSEADLYAYAAYRRACELSPPEVPRFPEGTWCLDRFESLWHLRRYRIAELVFPEGDPQAPAWGWNSGLQPGVIAKYVSWLQAGSEPPPLTALEYARGRIVVQDGHNRAASLVQVGRSEVLVWVSPAYVAPNGHCRDLTHALAVEVALRAGKPVPPQVLAEYPDLATVAQKERYDETPPTDYLL